MARHRVSRALRGVIAWAGCAVRRARRGGFVSDAQVGAGGGVPRAGRGARGPLAFFKFCAL